MPDKKQDQMDKKAHSVTNQLANCDTEAEYDNLIAAFGRQCAKEARREWKPIDTAPKGYPALEQPSEWFLAYGGKGPGGTRFAVIRRCFGHCFGPWECSGDAYYKPDFFTHWMPMPEAPSAAESKEGEGVI